MLPTEIFGPTAATLGLDVFQHELVLRRLALGTLLENAGSVASLIAAISFLTRTTASIVRSVRNPAMEGQANG